MKITLSEANRLQVFMPRYVAIERLYAFLDTKKQWIIKHNKKLRQAILLPELSKEEEIIRRDILRAEAQAFYEKSIPSSFKKKPSNIQVRKQKTRWGSCSSLGTISLNVYISFLTKELREYIYLHELCHLEHPHHQVAFWLALEDLCPGAKEKEKQLKNYRLPL